MAGNQGRISRVPVSSEEIKKAYSTLSLFYSLAEGVFERGLRDRSLKLLSVKAGEVVLEIGFGTGYSLKEIASAVGEKGKAYGIDITPEMLKITGKRLNRAGLMERVALYEGDARKMPYEDNKFDAIYMASTLELFDTPDIPRILKEIKRVLKPGGRLGIASLTREGDEGSLFIRIYEWLHRRSPKYISCRPIYLARSLKNAGFKIIKTDRFSIFKVAPYELVLAK